MTNRPTHAKKLKGALADAREFYPDSPRGFWLIFAGGAVSALLGLGILAAIFGG